MRLGIFAKTFPGNDPAAVLAAARDAGFGEVQFNLACAGLPAMPDAVSPEALAAIRAASERAGVTLAALSGTYNMAHPDPAVRETGRRRLGVVIAAAAALGIPLVTLCTGTRDPEDQWRHHPGNADPSAWRDMAGSMGRALDEAERHGVDLGIEPEPGNVVTSAELAVRLIGEMASPRLRIVLDPANLMERPTAAALRAAVASAVEVSGGAIAMAHAKDRAADGRVVPAGQGVVDFPDFLARLGAGGFDGPLVTHGLEAADAPAVAAFLRGLL
jgi:sugar phosphate isomerase/epimerase